MTAELLDALEPAADLDGEDRACTAIATSAAHRITRRRRLRLAGFGAAAAILLAVAGAVALTAPRELPPSTEPAEPDVMASQPGSGVVYAEELLRGAASRLRTADGSALRQEALACRERTDASTPVPCRAVWVGDTPFLELDPEMTLATLHVTDRLVRLDVRWTVRNTGVRPLLLDRADLAVAVLTDPDGVADPVADQATDALTSSWWADDRSRLALNREAQSLERIEPGSAMRGWATFTAAAPRNGAARDPLWDVADGVAATTLTLQVGIPHTRTADPTAADVIVESSMPLTDINPAIAADHLLETFRPRARGGATPADAQAALLCDVPRSMRSSTFENYNIPYLARQVACEPGWVDGPVLVDAGTAEVRPGTPASVVVWDVANASGATLQVSRLQLLLEGRADTVRAGGDGLTLLGTAAVTPSSAWLADGRRLGWLSNAFYDYPLIPDAVVGGRDQLFPGMLSSGEIVGEDVIIEALYGGGRATAVATVPFLDDPSRVILLETPLAVAPRASASP
ncbi:hypothetical protein [Demequina phytophila]|uniref:hypothetical protein n=1 Tax=Demequina phytophila TaxID=1638981 RepID=UPI000784F214|nr:hypothetical protein [Demequina phytophila]